MNFWSVIFAHVGSLKLGKREVYWASPQNLVSASHFQFKVIRREPEETYAKLEQFPGNLILLKVLYQSLKCDKPSLPYGNDFLSRRAIGGFAPPTPIEPLKDDISPEHQTLTESQEKKAPSTHKLSVHSLHPARHHLATPPISVPQYDRRNRHPPINCVCLLHRRLMVTLSQIKL